MQTPELFVEFNPPKPPEPPEPPFTAAPPDLFTSVEFIPPLPLVILIEPPAPP